MANTTQPKIKAILRIIIPRTFTGEAAFVYTDTETGRSVEGKANCGTSNIRGLIRIMNGGEWEGNDQPRTYVTEEEMGNRAFNRMTQTMREVGSNSSEFAEFITNWLNFDCPYCKKPVECDDSKVNGIYPVNGADQGCIFCEGLMPKDV